MKQDKRLKILTWHVHGNYLYYLTQTNCIFYIPVLYPPHAGYYGKTENFPWGENVIEVPANQIKNLDFDCIVFQSNYNPQNPDNNYLQEQISVLSRKQLLTIPKIFVEHDPPRNHPTDTRHIFYNSDITLVHVTSFNQLMWNSGNTTTYVINHGVMIPRETYYTGDIRKGIVVINGLKKRGRRLGLDIFLHVRKEIPLDLIGMESEELGGLGEISPQEVPLVAAKYRFLFHPARYTSLGLSVLEAMMVGLPIIGLSTTELPTVIHDGKNGYIHTDLNYLINKMKYLLTNKNQAKKMGIKARETAMEKFNIQRFADEWERLIEHVVLLKSVKKNSRYLQAKKDSMIL